jgi:uncharacterized protein
MQGQLRSIPGGIDGLKRRIREKEKLLVSFSGGVDSSLLAKVAHDVLGAGALAVVLDCETLPRSELEGARDLARSLDLNLRIARFSLLEDEEFARNPVNRCYLCKKRSAQVLKGIAEAEGIACIADGLNLSDYGDYRPGISACDEEGIWHPFVEAEMTKQDIREVSRCLGLPFWNKPTSACLSSRIPYGQRITEDCLRMVEQAEDRLRSMGFGQLRVRCHGNLARIELSREDGQRALDQREEIARMLKTAGFDYVTLDLEGFRSGSMNEVLWTLKR